MPRTQNYGQARAARKVIVQTLAKHFNLLSV